MKNNFGDLSEKKLVAMDICALYPSIKIEVALEAIESALRRVSNYTDTIISGIVELTKYSLKNSVLKFKETWYKSIEGVPTGGPESPQVANILVKYVIDEKILQHSNLEDCNFLSNRSRFLDDIWGTWDSTETMFSEFLVKVNEIGSLYGITFTGECGESVVFLDVRTSIENNIINTTMHIKPTDSERYLHRRSGHSSHTFSGLPYCQYRRAVLICSKTEDALDNINRMENKFLKSGYDLHSLRRAKDKILSLNRNELISKNTVNFEQDNSVKTMVVTIQFDPSFKKVLKDFWEKNRVLVTEILGETNIIVAERRMENLGNMLFQKSSFSRSERPTRSNQKCNASRCLTRENVNQPQCKKIMNTQIKLDFRLDCSSPSVVYLAECKLCTNGRGFYFGQTINSLMMRCNGHRDKFKVGKEDLSALSAHISEKHPENFGDKLNNYNFGIIKSAPPERLDRIEDFYIYTTDAEILGLNRYKVR